MNFPRYLLLACSLLGSFVALGCDDSSEKKPGDGGDDASIDDGAVNDPDATPDAEVACSPEGAVRWEVTDGGNGHCYLLVAAADISWTDAKAAAEDLGGYLATVTSADENAFVYALIEDDGAAWNTVGQYEMGPWLGGYQGEGAEEPAGGWTWVTDEPFAYDAWRPESGVDPQPNNSGGNENYLHFMGYEGREALWNDSADDAEYAQAYVLEVE
jgi:hypothetical protein